MRVLSCFIAGAVVVWASAARAGDLAERIAAAVPGATVEVGAGVYRGPFRVDKPLRLIGVGRPTLEGGGDGDVVEITAPDVEIRGFVIRGTGSNLDLENTAVRVRGARAKIEDNDLEDVLFGIDLKETSGCVVRGNRIGGKALDIARRGDALRLWRSDGCLVENNTFHGGRDVLLWYSNGITIRGNSASGCRYGFHLMYSNDVVLENNELKENSVGVYFMYSAGLTLKGNRLVRNRGPSGYGLGLKDSDGFRIEGNIFVGNRAGMYIDGSPVTPGARGEFIGNTVAYNDVGMSFLPSVHGGVFCANSFVDNVEQVSILGRGELTGNEFARAGRGNFWSDYAGYDGDGDGIGDSEYESRRLFESLIDREPKLRILLFSPAQQAIEFVGRALPAVEPEPKFSDPSPLMRPETNSAGTAVVGARLGPGLAAGALLGVAASIGLGAFGGGVVPRARVRAARAEIGRGVVA